VPDGVDCGVWFSSRFDSAGVVVLDVGHTRINGWVSLAPCTLGKVPVSGLLLLRRGFVVCRQVAIGG